MIYLTTDSPPDILDPKTAIKFSLVSGEGIF